MSKTTAYIIPLIAGLMAVSAAYCAEAPIEVFKYESKGKRDPFVPLVGQEKGKSAGLETVTSIQDVALEGIAIGASGKNVAILNGRMVKENDKIGVLEIKKITQKSVRLSIDGDVHTLSLQEPEKGR
jgi:hypothetical protein